MIGRTIAARADLPDDAGDGSAGQGVVRRRQPAVVPARLPHPHVRARQCGRRAGGAVRRHAVLGAGAGRRLHARRGAARRAGGRAHTLQRAAALRGLARRVPRREETGS